MVREQLIINGTTIPLDKGLGTILTYSIKDIQKPDKRKSSFSKTVTIPGSKVVNELFNFIFEINSDSTFNPKIKTSVIYLIDDIAVFKGITQLKKVDKTDNEHYTYDIVLLGELANLFTDLGDSYVDDSNMLWNNLDHIYKKDEIENSWTTSYMLSGVATPFLPGSGYTYPMISYNSDSDKTLWFTDDFKPSIFAKEYIDRMFSAAGFEYTSTFFDSSYFRNLIIPYTGKGFVKRDINLVDLISKYDVGLFNSTGTAAITTSTVGGVTSTGSYDAVRFTNVITDANSQYTVSTGEYTSTQVGGVYPIGRFNITVDFTSGAAVNCDMTSTFVIEMSFFKNGSIIQQDKAFIKLDNPLTPSGYTTTEPTTFEDADFKQQIVDFTLLPNSVYSRQATTPNFYTPGGGVVFANNTTDVLTFMVRGYFVSDTGLTKNFTDGTGIEYDGSATINLLASSSIEYAPYAGTTYLNVVDMFTVIPTKIKKRDFLKSIVEMFNLYIEPDLDNPRKLTIEPREDFYTNNIVDWSSKLDVSKKINYDLLNSGGFVKYSYSYKQDKDYYNKKYNDAWQRVYGNREVDVIDDFGKAEYKQSIIFSPTPSVGSIINNRVIPSMIGVDKDLQPISTNTNIRILQYSGLKPSNMVWDFKEHTASLSDYQTTYPYCGHFFPDAFNPTEDLNYGLPKEIYWDNTFNTITLTNNNLFNKYHRKELEQATDKDSKLVTAFFLLNPLDISTLDFKAQYFFDNAYFRLQEVKYNPNSYTVSKCKFLKLKSADDFTPITIIAQGGGGKLDDEDLPIIVDNTIQTDGNVLSEKSGTVLGSDNSVPVSVKSFEIIGDNNIVGSYSKNIFIQGDNNLVASHLTNITLINSSDLTITKSDTIYINGVEQAGDSVVETKSADFTPQIKVTTYEVDTIAGDVTITLPTLKDLDGIFDGKIWNFKKKVKANKIILLAGNIDGQTSIDIKKQYTNLTVQFNQETYIIL